MLTKTRIERIAAKYHAELGIKHEDVRFLLAAAHAGAALAQEFEEEGLPLTKGFRRAALARYITSVAAGAGKEEPCNSSSPR